MTVPFNRDIYDTTSAILICLLITMICYNMFIFVRMKVYRTYSTSCLLLFCVALLIFRTTSLVVFVFDQDLTRFSRSLVECLFLDIPTFLRNQINLCLIY